MTEPPPTQPLDRPVASWCVLGAFILLYLPTCARLPQAGDALEFLMVAAGGGVPHPPGYPLFLLAARGVVLLLPFGALAWKVSALSAVLAAATVAVIHRAVLRATDDGVAAAFAAGSYGTSVLFWRWSVVSEVLSGATLTAALVLLVCVRVARGGRGRREAMLLGLAFATGVAHHHTAILLLPVMAWAWVALWPRPVRPRGVAEVTALVVGCSLVGLLPYLTLMAPGGVWRWGDTSSWGGLVHHFLRADYGTLSTGQLSRGVALHVQPALYLGGVARQLVGLSALLGAVGFVVAFRGRTGRGFAAALLATWLLAGPLFVTRFDLPAEGFYRMVVERFHILPNLLVALAVGYGTVWFRGLRIWSRPAVPTALLSVNLLLAGAMALPAASMRDLSITDDFLRNTLGAVEPDALIVTQGDTFHFGCEYALRIEELRRDVACVAPGLVDYEWYRRRLARLYPGLTLERDGRPLTLSELVAAHVDRRPVYLSVRVPIVSPGAMAGIPPYWPAAGTLLRVSGGGKHPPPPALVEASLLRDWEGFELRSRLVDVSELNTSADSTTWDHYALVWMTLATGYESAGDADGAERCRERARALSPWLLEE